MNDCYACDRRIAGCNAASMQQGCATARWMEAFVATVISASSLNAALLHNQRHKKGRVFHLLVSSVKLHHSNKFRLGRDLNENVGYSNLALSALRSEECLQKWYYKTRHVITAIKKEYWTTNRHTQKIFTRKMHEVTNSRIVLRH